MNYDYDIWFDNGRWVVRGLGGPPATYPTQQEAIFAAKSCARLGRKTVVWRDRSGRVQGRASYADVQVKSGRTWLDSLMRRKPSKGPVDLEEAPSVKGAAS